MEVTRHSAQDDIPDGERKWKGEIWLPPSQPGSPIPVKPEPESSPESSDGMPSNVLTVNKTEETSETGKSPPGTCNLLQESMAIEKDDTSKTREFDEPSREDGEDEIKRDINEVNTSTGEIAETGKSCPVTCNLLQESMEEDVVSKTEKFDEPSKGDEEDEITVEIYEATGRGSQGTYDLLQESMPMEKDDSKKNGEFGEQGREDEEDEIKVEIYEVNTSTGETSKMGKGPTGTRSLLQGNMLMDQDGTSKNRETDVPCIDDDEDGITVEIFEECSPVVENPAPETKKHWFNLDGRKQRISDLVRSIEEEIARGLKKRKTNLQVPDLGAKRNKLDDIYLPYLDQYTRDTVVTLANASNWKLESEGRTVDLEDELIVPCLGKIHYGFRSECPWCAFCFVRMKDVVHHMCLAKRDSFRTNRNEVADVTFRSLRAKYPKPSMKRQELIRPFYRNIEMGGNRMCKDDDTLDLEMEPLALNSVAVKGWDINSPPKAKKKTPPPEECIENRCKKDNKIKVKKAKKLKKTKVKKLKKHKKSKEAQDASGACLQDLEKKSTNHVIIVDKAKNDSVRVNKHKKIKKAKKSKDKKARKKDKSLLDKFTEEGTRRKRVKDKRKKVPTAATRFFSNPTSSMSPLMTGILPPPESSFFSNTTNRMRPKATGRGSLQPVFPVSIIPSALLVQNIDLGLTQATPINSIGQGAEQVDPSNVSILMSSVNSLYPGDQAGESLSLSGGNSGNSGSFNSLRSNTMPNGHHDHTGQAYMNGRLGSMDDLPSRVLRHQMDTMSDPLCHPMTSVSYSQPAPAGFRLDQPLLTPFNPPVSACQPLSTMNMTPSSHVSLNKSPSNSDHGMVISNVQSLRVPSPNSASQRTLDEWQDTPDRVAPISGNNLRGAVHREQFPGPSLSCYLCSRRFTDIEHLSMHQCLGGDTGGDTRSSSSSSVHVKVIKKEPLDDTCMYSGMEMANSYS